MKNPNEILVCKKLRLGKDGDSFSKKLIAQEERTSVKITRGDMEEFNKSWDKSGRLYVIDEEKTAERNKALNPEPEVKSIEQMKVGELKEYIILKEYDIDVSQKKDELIAAIKEVEKED